MRISDWSSDVCSSDLHLFLLFFSSRVLLSPHNAHSSRRCDFFASRLFILLFFILLPFPILGYLSGKQYNSCYAKEIGRASCREIVCQYLYISVVAVSLKKK